YPPENAALMARIATHGTVIAECPLGTVPHARHFPRRNRIISGLSLAVVVIEAAAKSGSLITARMALDQGRDVFAVPGSPLDPRSRGGNGLIRQGAALVEGPEDVLALLGPRAGRHQPTAGSPSPTMSEPDPKDVETAQLRVLELLGPDPVEVDELIRQCQLSAPAVLAVLLDLELAGRLERLAVNRVARLS
ncbi:MAG: DNA-processing protein DprA, partial [Alphaproteobacteria bacterium]|nr:DNA-processing protein DprA [Alphaproteobacteria bacterium]